MTTSAIIGTVSYAYNSFKTGREGINLFSSAVWKVADHVNKTDFSGLNFGDQAKSHLTPKKEID
jgi:hypothetical protein